MIKATKKATKSLIRWLKAEGQEGIETPQTEEATFRLDFGDLEVGTLELRAGVWEFRYSDTFRHQVGTEGGVRPLIDFPDVSKPYRSDELWPFFMARIPSPAQPRILAEITRRGIDRTSTLDLLRAFGEWSIANPFRLHAA